MNRLRPSRLTVQCLAWSVWLAGFAVAILEAGTR